MRARSALAVVLGGVLLALAGCDDDVPLSTDPTAADVDFVVSYTGAAGRLAGLDAVENRAQVLDWARIGLAADLGLDTARVRDALYDVVPVRDGGFADLSRQATGAGRALFDGKVLHLLVATDDPRRSRTVGQLLDQYRTDSGGDPEQVRVHGLTVHPDAATVDVRTEEPTSAGEARAANGYVTARVDQVSGLADFLARTRSLSTVEVRGAEVWASGWNWSDSGAALDAADVSVLQRGYRSTERRTPAFSLDPQRGKTAADLVAALPGLSAETAERVLSGNWAGTAFGSSAEVVDAVADVLHGSASADSLGRSGLPTSRESLWGLWSALDGGPVYSEARYDGGLAGTAVGMTLFYTDYVAKNWVNGTGDGVPAGAVEGFVPDPDAVTPWSQCETGLSGESGRLWFGQNESAFAHDSSKISIGAQSTRLFSRSDGAAGDEVEPSFAAGRGLRWWDQHYQAVADHEPQYQRLDQIMRWSGALEWLAATTSATLPQLPDSEIPSTSTFADWYAKSGDLRERAPVRFVAPPSATREAVIVAPSKSYESCGYRVISGGVSLGDLIARTGTRDYRPTLPAPVSRAGLFDAGSTFDPVSGTGSIKQVSVDGAGTASAAHEHAFRVVDGKAVVDVTAPGRKVVQFGDLKLMVPETAQRRLSTAIDAHDGRVSQRVDYEGREFGELTAERDASLVTITWRRGVVDRVRGVLDAVQRTFAAAPEGVPSAKDGVLYAFRDPAGRVLNRVGGAGDPWLSISGDLPPAGDAPVFRLGAPNPDGGGPRFQYGEMVAAPTVPEGRWLDVAPATADGPAAATFADGPPADAKTVRVTVRDGRSAEARLVGDHARVDPNDPILGVAGSAEGAAVLRDLSRIVGAGGDAAPAGDGLWRAVRLGEDGAALVDGTEVRIVSGDDPWGARVLRAVGTDPERTVLVRVRDDHAVVVDRSDLTEVPGSGPELMDLGQALQTPDADLYLHESFRASLSVEDGRVVANSLPRQERVTVRKATVAERTSVPNADVRAGGGAGRGAEWLRIDLPPRTGAVNTTPSPAPTTTPPARPGGTTAAAGGGLVLLICPADGDALLGCGD